MPRVSIFVVNSAFVYGGAAWRDMTFYDESSFYCKDGYSVWPMMPGIEGYPFMMMLRSRGFPKYSEICDGSIVKKI